MSLEKNKAIARLHLEEMHNKKNIGIADLVFNEYCVIHLGQSSFNREEYKKLIKRYASAFPDLHITVEDQIAEGDKVVTHWTTRFTHKDEFMGIPPTGKQITLPGISIYRIADEKIAEIWISWDRFGMMQQIGVLGSLRD